MTLKKWLDKLLGVNWHGDIFQITDLDLTEYRLSNLPESIGELTNLRSLKLGYNNIDNLPRSIGKLVNLRNLQLNRNSIKELSKSIEQLTNLQELNLEGNGLNNLPESIGRLTNLRELNLADNRLSILPESIGQLANLRTLNLGNNSIDNLPGSIGKLTNLQELSLAGNRLSSLPGSIGQLTNLQELNLRGNQIRDLSFLHKLEPLTSYRCFRANLPRRYWTKLSEWQPEWLLDEKNAEIRRLLIQNIGYEKICNALGAQAIDSWREYTLLKIKDIEPIYGSRNISVTTYNLQEMYEFLEIMDMQDLSEELNQLYPRIFQGREPIRREPMVLLKMTCPSTGHIHILRVPPQMSSAEAAITWVNNSIHPDDFSIQT
jgi:leucine-rich repeat protein SHOC2